MVLKNSLTELVCFKLLKDDIIKVTTLKVQSKGRYLLLKKSFLRTTTNGW